MLSKDNGPPIISFVGSSGAGKTTLLEKLIPELTRRGLKVGTIKHDIHDFEMDRQGKDSWRHKQAGASITILSSPHRIGMVMDVDHDYNPDELAPLFCNIDIVLSEGYKYIDMPKIEVFRPEAHKEIILKDDKNLVALVSDVPVDLDLPRFSTGDIKQLADFLIDYFEVIPAELALNREAEMP